MSSRKSLDPPEELTRPVQFVKGVGPARAELLQTLGVKTVADLLFFFPRRYQDYSNLCTVDQLRAEHPASIVGIVHEFEQTVSQAGRTVLYMLLRQDRQFVRAIWFNQPYLLQRLQVGQRVLLRGTPRQKLQRWEIVQPKISWIASEQEPLQGQIFAVYPATAGLGQNEIRRMVRSVVEEHVEQLPEVFPEAFLQQHQLAGIVDAVRWIHEPSDEAHLQKARRRFVYQELLVLQLALAMRRAQIRNSQTAAPLLLDARLQARIERRFPFELTDSQKNAIAEITADMSRSEPMNRLLHGEVGSGKTAVATYAMLLAVAHGYSAVLMAPTEVLARQHFRTLKNLLRASRVRLELCSGALTQAEKKQLQQRVIDNEVDILIGTSAVIYGDLQFQRLGLVVIDEQHKFGVRQRARLKQTGLDPHYLVMTATPIPRTTALTTFGDLDVSELHDQRRERAQVHTYLAAADQQEKWWDFYKKKISEGRQGFVVTPLVDNETDGGAEQAYEALANGLFEEFRVDLLHGRQSPDEKEAAMLAFERGQTQIVVATSVVEVGIDVPNATVMAILSPQRFGLSQLHQMRGRVGRGQHPGYVGLILDEQSEPARERLEAFAKTSDGFELAELDFQLRGPGELLGTRQHGVPAMRIADLRADQALLEEARKAARDLVECDPGMVAPAFARLRKLLIRRYGRLLELADVG